MFRRLCDLGWGRLVVTADGVQKGKIAGKVPGHLSGPATDHRGLRHPGQWLPWGMWPLRSLQAGAPVPAKHPQAVKELTPPTVADTRGGGCSLSSWPITLGHREREGLKQPLCLPPMAVALSPPARKWGEKPARLRTSAGSLAPVAWPRGSGRACGICAVWARPARKRFYTGHVTAASDQVSSFKQHRKYSSGEPEAKYGTACGCPVWTFSCHSEIQLGTHKAFGWPGVQLLGPKKSPRGMADSGWVQLAQGRAGFFPVCSTPECPSRSLSPLPQGGLGGSPLICPAGPLMALQSLLPTPRLQPCQPGPGSLPGVSSLVEGRPPD